MRTRLQHFDGLFGDQQLDASSDFFQCESLEVRSKAYNWEITEHFHSDLLQLFFIRSGGGRFSLSKKQFLIEEKSVLLIPANTLHGFQFEEGVEGEVMTFSTRFPENLMKGRPEMQESILSRNQLNFQQQPECFDRLLVYYQCIEAELPEHKIEKWAVVRSLLELILTELYRSSFEAERLELLTSHRSLAYYQQFLTSVKRQMNQSIAVSAYAADVGITVVHLNRVCREVVGKSALEVVQEVLLQEAKNYLLNTQYSIAEIAYFLNFNDPAYFNRLFKKKVGVPPGEFRRG
ncbi:helix-turn-helix domain-containing protein [Jiulongibacter sediminis]|uniref:HTH araC/xylS-type domain-containing protein n=1 Tax=Jiulongibacter sediminis TaxID=1605367 RepID=A0A0N8HA16_9BACT|nr:helix-turn-helix domain-containing protein [Jiulongibacter sediminis]KPM48916.1 hypothetical protein AFM12_10200 [Jiulongibacter sediminis]TBX25445.1 hypothetical protein TK44_10205 [Jiulongibacter sediminis]